MLVAASLWWTSWEGVLAPSRAPPLQPQRSSNWHSRAVARCLPRITGKKLKLMVSDTCGKERVYYRAHAVQFHLACSRHAAAAAAASAAQTASISFEPSRSAPPSTLPSLRFLPLAHAMFISSAARILCARCGEDCTDIGIGGIWQQRR